MSPRTIHLLLASLAVLPHLGCLTAGSGANPSEITPVSVTGSSPQTKEAELPARESARARLKVAQDLEKNGDLAGAVVYYEMARQADPKLKQVSRRLAVLYDKLDEPKQALEEYELALQLTPRDVNLLNDVGYYYYGRGQWDKAEQYLRQALKIDPKHKRAWNNLGLALGQQGRYDESLQAFQHVMSEAEAHSNLAFVLSTQGKRDEAKQEYRKALALEPDLRLARVALDRLEHPKATAKGKGPGDRNANDLARRAADVATERFTAPPPRGISKTTEQQAQAEKAEPAESAPGFNVDLVRLMATVMNRPTRPGERVAEALPTPPSPEDKR